MGLFYLFTFKSVLLHIPNKPGPYHHWQAILLTRLSWNFITPPQQDRAEKRKLSSKWLLCLRGRCELARREPSLVVQHSNQHT